MIKKLKDAGFDINHYDSSGHCCNCHPCEGELELPTLSKLIEACIKDFRSREEFRLSFDGIIWEAGFAYFDIDSQADNFNYNTGKTPEEAIANFWLELNKKK